MERIAEGIVTDEVLPRLIGGKCRKTGKLVFPCPPDEAFEPAPLSREGIVWSYTIQRFRPKSPPYAGPEEFEPYAVAYVEIPGEVIVETRLVNVDFDAIEIGMPVELTMAPFQSSNATDTVLIHAFQPTDERRRL